MTTAIDKWANSCPIHEDCPDEERTMHYIQRRGNGYLETVDEFTTRKEARSMLTEYRLSDPSAEYWISSRACKAWKED